MQSNNVHGHTGRDAVIGGLAGHEGHHGHTARDAAIGGMAGHVAKDHREDRAATGAPSVGDKISGGIDKLTGKITNNPAKVAEGQAKTGTL
ncbi:hypothetical protein EHS25_007318 [Saitozyma podzolica]|uniref:Uncharacterized protein n=1 Tax=Saitozyma podzolica TaxID=1890683 RepID=A0A427XMM9_9TREE|nr:hypothetical protein EHS25_007318 [Saitozyma podzolica]